MAEQFHVRPRQTGVVQDGQRLGLAVNRDQFVAGRLDRRRLALVLHERAAQRCGRLRGSAHLRHGGDYKECPVHLIRL
jgi:hypothetical protein